MAKQQKREDPIRQFCSFWIGERLYGADIQVVKEINSELKICPIPHAADEILGYVNIRGQIHLIIDLRRRLGFPPQEVDKEARLMLFKHSGGDAYGILVDRIGDVIEVHESQIEEKSHSETQVCDTGNQFLTGICQLEKSLLIVIDPRVLLDLVRVHHSDVVQDSSLA